MRLAIVCPCYNEEAVLPLSVPRLLGLLDRMQGDGLVGEGSYVLLVNDGSADRTWELIAAAHTRDARVRGVDLRHNVGHQYALLAGLMEARHDCDAAVSVDVDLQDDIEAIVEMVQAYHQGHDVVYGVKVSRKGDSWSKRVMAQGFYRLQRRLGVRAVYNHADFRLMGREVLDALAQYDERNMYLRGLMPRLAHHPAMVDDAISERAAGRSKYTFFKSLALALDGITSFSIKPLHLITLCGILFIFIALGIAVYVVYSLVAHVAVPGWASLMGSIWFIGGVMLLSLGVVGEYIGMIYMEVKRRPRYHVREYLGGEDAVAEGNNQQ